MSVFRSCFFPLLKRAIPFGLTGLLQASIFLFETMFLSRLGADVLAAGALVTWLYTTLIVIIIGILGSTNILISYHLGSKDHNKVQMVVRDSFWLAIFLLVPVFIIVWNIADTFSLIGQNPTTIELAKDYLHALSWGLLPHFIVIALLELIIGLGYGALFFTFTAFSVSLSIFFSFCFIFGKFGFPALGIAGAGWGITLSYWLTLFVLIFYMIADAAIRYYLKKIITYSKFTNIFELLRIGIPMGAMYCLEMAFFLVLTIIMSWLGTDTVAANQIALQYMETFTAVVFSIAQALTVRMSYLLGARELLLAKSSAYIGIFLSTLFMLVIGGIELCFTDVFISFDFDVNNVDSISMVELARDFLAVSTVFQLFEAVRLTLFGALRSLKDTRLTLMISVTCFWLIALPLGYFLALNTALGSVGLWWGMVIGSACSVPLIFWRLSSFWPHQTEAFAS